MKTKSVVSISTEEIISHSKGVDSTYWEVECVGPKPSSDERKDLIFSPTTTIISIRCVFKRMGSLFSGTKNWKVWTALEKKDHINVLELKAAKHAI